LEPIYFSVLIAYIFDLINNPPLTWNYELVSARTNELKLIYTGTYIHRNLYTQEHEFTSSWVNELMSSWVHKFMSSWVHEFTSSWVHEFMSSRVHEFMSSQVHEFMSWWVHEFMSSWVDEFTSLWIYEFIRSSIKFHWKRMMYLAYRPVVPYIVCICRLCWTACSSWLKVRPILEINRSLWVYKFKSSKSMSW